MFRNASRRFACLVLGLWLGAGVCVDLLVTQNFATVDRFIAAPGSPGATALVKQDGAKSIRFILRRNAAEENAWIFEKWEWTQMGVATGLFCLILFGERRRVVLALVLIPAMLAIIVLQNVLLTPRVASLGREIDEIPAREQVNNPTVSEFWGFHGVYSGCEILKLLLGIGLAARLMVRLGNRSPKEDESDKGAVRVSARQPGSAGRIPRRPGTLDQRPDPKPDLKHG